MQPRACPFPCSPGELLPPDLLQPVFWQHLPGPCRSCRIAGGSGGGRNGESVLKPAWWKSLYHRVPVSARCLPSTGQWRLSCGHPQGLSSKAWILENLRREDHILSHMGRGAVLSRLLSPLSPLVLRLRWGRCGAGRGLADTRSRLGVGSSRAWGEWEPSGAVGRGVGSDSWWFHSHPAGARQPPQPHPLTSSRSASTRAPRVPSSLQWPRLCSRHWEQLPAPIPARPAPNL